jgi:hypothetical protein
MPDTNDGKPVEFAEVLAEELKQVAACRRAIYAEARRRFPKPDPGAAPPPPTPPRDAAPAGAAAEPQKLPRLEALDQHLAGLALSGGGIRSATFALGVLQGLASLKLLSRFDYLSTVSGGGYIGSWLAAWVKREGRFLEVEDQLAPSRVSQAAPARPPLGAGTVVDEEPEPVHHLRAYSNYLTPRPGLLSIDTWTVGVIYVRNALINQLFLLPLALLLVLAGRLVVLFYALSPKNSAGLRHACFAAFAGLFALAVCALSVNVIRLQRQGAAPGRSPLLRLKASVVWPLVAVAVLACWCFTIAPPERRFLVRDMPLEAYEFELRLPAEPKFVGDIQPYVNETPFPFLRQLDSFSQDAYEWWYEKERFLLYSCLEWGLWFAILSLGAHAFGYLVSRVWRGGRRAGAEPVGVWDGGMVVVRTAFAAATAGFTGGFLFATFASEVLWRNHGDPLLAVTVGPPAVLVVIVAATFVKVWLLGRLQPDGVREWWARTCAWLVVYAFGWLVFFAVTLYGPMLVRELWAHRLALLGAAAGWLATAVGGAFAGRSPASQDKENGGGLKPLLLKLLVLVAPVVFIVGLFVVVAMVVDVCVVDRWEDRVPHVEGDPPEGSAAYRDGVQTTRLTSIFVAGGACVMLVGLASVMTNVNLFSMNSLYAQRLTRCYLGASRRKRGWAARGAEWAAGSGGAPTGASGAERQEEPITGFDPDDDIPLYRMRVGPDPARTGAGRRYVPPQYADKEYVGPQLILNTALNLVAGTELAWQDRKAESFTLTPTFCGSKGTGYARTVPATGVELSLGRAVSISGAAVDSNVGVHQSSALIALMTAFNARLGWWMKNPARPGWDAGSPSLALPLLFELLGWTDSSRNYVHVSDGGHFENLGVYELVRRRCRYVVCTDAGTDPQASDDNLANLIRLCRTDFGVRIEVDTSPFVRAGGTGPCRGHVAVGRIRYDDVDGGERPGVFVLLRTTLTGDEPPDVQEYADKNPTFPWQSTADQFFDEAQFESYRALGFHVATAAFDDAVDDLRTAACRDAGARGRVDSPFWGEGNAHDEFRRNNQHLFSALQRRWAPAPPNLDETFRQSTEAWVAFQEALRSEPALAPLGAQIYPEWEQIRAPAGGAAADDRAVVHAVAQMIQIMENTWIGLQLAGSRGLPITRGWMSVFRRWAATDAVRRNWPVLRVEFSQDFVKFCETELALGYESKAVRRSALDADFVTAAVAALGAEYAREWPGQKSLVDLLAAAEKSWKDAKVAEFPSWLYVLAPTGTGAAETRPDRFPCGIAFARVLPDDDPKWKHRFEVFVWLRRAYRSMGIASRNGLSLLREFDAAARPLTGGEVRLSARYPAGPAGHGHAEELEIWKSFFSHFDFRNPVPGGKPDGSTWLLERTFRPGDLDTWQTG